MCSRRHGTVTVALVTLAADMFDICHRDPTADFEETQAERLGTAMALYSTNALKAIVHLVDNNFTHDPEDFTRVRHFDSFSRDLPFSFSSPIPSHARRVANFTS